MRIIIALDIIGGKCIRLTQGDFNSIKVYNEDPLEVAKEIEDNGLKYLHMVDLDGARNRKITNHRILERISAKTSLSIDYGGGIRSDDDLRIAFDSGAGQVTCGSIAVRSPEVFLGWLAKYGPDRIILGADCMNRKIVTEGWTDQSDKDIIDFISVYASKGVKYVICTDVEKDGMLEGPSSGLYSDILSAVNVKLIASGGISSIDDLEKIESTRCEGSILGKAVYEGKIKLKDLKKIC